MSAYAPIVLSLGGSLIVPATGIDVGFLKEFRELILSHVHQGKRFIIIGGGGSTARAYMHAARDVATLVEDDMDWLGIHACRLNGHLLRTIFRDEAHPVMIKDPRRKLIWKEPILIGTGWRPGRSTDDVAVRLAMGYSALEVINLTNIERVYDKDPKKYADAKPFATLSWKEMQALVGSEWHPGSNAPFDPIATKRASRARLKVVIAKGSDLNNLDRILTGQSFIGTTIE